MMVELVAITPDAENLIGYCARVSNPNATKDMDSARLLSYMLEHKHWSPFEIANMVIRVETSRAISAQILRHRSFAFQEFSQRYAEVQEFVTYPARSQDPKNRQSSIDDIPVELQNIWAELQRDVQRTAEEKYKMALSFGIAKECARFLLPMSSKTILYMNGSIRSWIHYLQLRTDDSTQLEHRLIAREIGKIFIEQFPNIAKALDWGYGD